MGDWRQRVEGKAGFSGLLAIVFFGLYASFLLLTVARGIDDKLQWDFKSHYCAARVHELGLNFYDQPYLRHYCSPDASQYYSYTPLSIWFFRFFSLFPFSTAYFLFLILKILGLAALFIIWVKYFLEKKAGPGFYIFTLLVFNGALFLDLRSGNVSLIEQVGLWLGFLFLLKRKPALFSLCVILVSTFKVVPLAFLALLLFTGERRKYRYFFGSLGAFAALHGLSFALNPFLFKEFLRVFSTMLSETFGVINPSTYVLLLDLWSKAGGISRLLPVGVFALTGVLVVALTWKALVRLRKHPDSDNDKIVIFLFCLTYALLMPRFKDYSYILLIVPVYFALKKYTLGLERGFLFFLAVLSVAENTSLPGFEVVFRYLWNYFPLFTAAAAWGLFLHRAFKPGAIPPPPGSGIATGIGQ